MSEHPFIESNHGEPHSIRRAQILARYPQAKELYGYDRRTALVIVALVGVQFSLAYALSVGLISFSSSIVGGLGFFALCYLIGAPLNHWLAMAIHECTHELAAKSASANRWLAIFAGLPGVAPAAMSFWHHHQAHHQFLGIEGRDNDLPSRWEVRWVKNSSLRKAFWLLTLPLTAPFTRGFLRKPPNRWEKINIAVQLSANVLIVALLGWTPLLYFALSTFFGNGLHPVASHWIHEHYTKDGEQETFSYYGPLNWLTFNVGYHVEHHDLFKIPGWRLPKLKAMAPEFYQQAQSHRSWTAVLLTFMFDSRFSHASRIVRTPETFRRSRKLLGSLSKMRLIESKRARWANQASDKEPKLGDLAA